MKVLKLTLKRQPFELMLRGAKTVEFRKPSDWIKSRLCGKEYNLIEFTNGYGAHRPKFFAKYEGLRTNERFT